MLGEIILSISLLFSITTGLFVFARNPKNIVNRLYALLTSSLVIFSIFNYLSLTTNDRLLFIRIVIFSTSVLVVSLFYLLVYINDTYKKGLILKKTAIISTAVISILDFTPLVFLKLSGKTNPVPVPNIGAFLFLLQLVLFLTGSFFILFKRMSRSKGVERLQYTYMLIGITPMFIFSPITGFILPILFKDPSLIVLSPLYGAFFLGFVGYAIVRHKLFDIRLVVARTITYILSLLSIAVMFAIISFSITDFIFNNNSHFQSLDIWIYSILSITLAITFPPLKSFFDKATNRMFYRDAYDSQSFLDDFNKILVSTYTLDPMLKRISDIIEDNLKPSYCFFEIYESRNSKKHIYGNNNKVDNSLAKDNLKEINHLMSKMNTKIMITDLLDEKYYELQKILRTYNVSVITKISSSLSSNDSLGYILLGAKKSGNVYNNQDLKVLEIVSNELVVAIQNALHTEEIEKFNITLQHRINEATLKLRKANQKLKELDETKDDFISMASHQLRTPLTSVKGYISMVLEEDAGKINKTQKDMLNQAFFSSQRMVYLIADLLNVSRLKTGKFIIESSIVNLADIVEQELSQLTETAASKSLKLIYDKPKTFPTLMLDETKTRQVIMNFVDNAIYYTPAGGEIKVKLIDKPETVELIVEDNGIGVPKAEQHHLFTKFYRAANARKARPDGTGLGLFMAKKVVVAEGGSIIFESEEGKGSTFGFSFSKAKLSPKQNINNPEKKENEKMALA